MDIINSVFHNTKNEKNIVSNKEIIQELKKNNVTYIIFENKLENSLPCVNVISFENLKVCKLKRGVAEICIGGGEATAIAIELA